MSGAFVVSVSMPDGSTHRQHVEEGADALVGRDSGCAVVLPSSSVSRCHLQIAASADGFFVTDHSANGTLIGDEALHRETRQVASGVPLRVGPYRLILERPETVGRCPSKPRNEVASAATLELRKRVHRLLLARLDLASLDRAEMDADAMRPRVVQALGLILDQLAGEIPQSVDRELLVLEMADEVLGLGPLQNLLRDDDVSEIMVVDPQTIYIEKAGRISLTKLRFTDDESCRSVIERIVTPLGRRIDESTPLVDARLKDGSRVNAVIPPLAVRGPCITIRKFAKDGIGLDELTSFQSMSPPMARFLERSVRARKNIVISGGTGSGKTTLLNALSGAIPSDERIVTIEDAAELRLGQPHVVALESKPPNLEGKGAYNIRDLVKNALRMRPDRIVVGECRSSEAIDMLQAMNTGHEGSMTTTHANSPVEAVKRIETLCLMAGLDLPSRAIREQIVTSIDLVVQQARFSDGSRRVTAITEIAGLEDNGELVLHDIFSFSQTGIGEQGKVFGFFRSTGYLPSFLDDFMALGLASEEYL